MRFAFLAALALGTVSCSGLPTSYAVTIEGFTDEQAAVVVDACRIWERSVADPARLRLFVNVNTSCDLGHDDAICIAASTTAKLKDDPHFERYGVTYHRARDVQPQSTIDPMGSMIFLATDTNDLRQTAEHEVGHALGLVHTGPGTVMAPEVQEAAPDVTPADVGQFLKVHDYK